MAENEFDKDAAQQAAAAAAAAIKEGVDAAEKIDGEPDAPSQAEAKCEGNNFSSADDEAQEKAATGNARALKEFDADWEAEKLCRWGAARAGAIAVVPFLGSVALIANEVYMITRLADMRGVQLSEGAALGLLGSLGATFAGQTIATLLPLPFLSVPIAVSVTYGVGRAANRWIKDGRPEDVASFREIFEEARREGMEKLEELKNNPDKDKPLGDEKKRFDLNGLKQKLKNVRKEDVQKKLDELKNLKTEDVSARAEEIFYKVMDKADRAEGGISEKIDAYKKRVGPLRKTGERFFSVQNWAQLKKGELVIPYSEISAYLVQAMAGSEISLIDIGFKEPERLKLQLKHVKYGTLYLEVSLLDFVVNQKEAYTHIKIETFDITDNTFASLVLQVVGDKLILAILGVIFDNTEIKRSGIRTVYTDSVVTVDFHDLLEEQEFSKKQIASRRLLEILNFVNLQPSLDGLKLSAKLRLRREADDAEKN